MRRELLRLTLPLREPWRGAVTQELAVVRSFGEDGAAGIADAPVPYEPAAYELSARDLAARERGEPFARSRMDSVRVNATIVAEDPGVCAERAREALELGFDCFKLKVGLAGDLSRTQAVREVIGRASELRLDANGAWSAGEAAGRIAELSAFDPSYVEQPCLTLEDMARVDSPVPLAADEPILGAKEVRDAARMGACSVVVVKIARAGGFGRAIEAVEAAREVGLGVVIASLLDGPWGVAAGLHLAAATGIEDACGLATMSAFAGPAADLLRPEGGRIALPVGPGLGIEVDPESLGGVTG